MMSKPALSTLPAHFSERLPALLAAACLLAGLSVLTGCGGADGKPVARLQVDPQEITLAHSTYEEVRLDWSMTSELSGVSGPLRVFVHLLDDQGRLTRTFDHAMPGGWAVGEERRDVVRLVQSALAPPLPPGNYRLSVGLYDGGGHRWPIDVEGERVDSGEYVVADVVVPSTPAAVPLFSFSPTWSPTLAGGDRQILAVRWLTGDGTILLEEVPGPGKLWLRIRIPEEGVGDAHRVMLPDHSGPAEPSVLVGAPCAGFQVSVSGEGSHDVEVPVTTDDGSCAIRLRPNYSMVSEGAEQQSMLLESIAWRATGASEPSEPSE